MSGSAARSGVTEVGDAVEVVALVAVTGIKDDVNDVIEPGAFRPRLFERPVKGALGHDWLGAVAVAEEARRADSRRPAAAAHRAGRHAVATRGGRAAGPRASTSERRRSGVRATQTQRSTGHVGIKINEKQFPTAEFPPVKLVIAINSSCVPQPPPGLRTDDAVLLQTVVRLEALDSGLRVGAEDAIDRDGHASVFQQVLHHTHGGIAIATPQDRESVYRENPSTLHYGRGTHAGAAARSSGMTITDHASLPVDHKTAPYGQRLKYKLDSAQLDRLGALAAAETEQRHPSSEAGSDATSTAGLGPAH